MSIESSISKRALAAFGPGAKAHDAQVLDSSIHCVEAGQGKPIVFIHGNPTSSFLWRKVFSRLSGQGRLLAVDLIGFGESGKPAIEYSLADHQRYVDGWLDSLDLHDVTLVLHDYGAAFGLSWARRNPTRVRAVALVEPIIRPILVFPRVLPVDGKPDSTVAVLDQNAAWLTSSKTPKILFTFEPGFLLPPDILEWSRSNIRNLQIRQLGAGNHYVPEDQPEAIAQAIADWLKALER